MSFDVYHYSEGEDEAAIENEDAYTDPEKIVVKNRMLNLSSIFKKHIISVCLKKAQQESPKLLQEINLFSHKARYT